MTGGSAKQPALGPLGPGLGPENLGQSNVFACFCMLNSGKHEMFDLHDYAPKLNF